MNEAHEILGVGPDAAPEQIRTAYRRLARRHHPDSWHAAPPMIQRHIKRKMAEINLAYEQIGPNAGASIESRREVSLTEAEREELGRRALYARWDRAEQIARARVEAARLDAIAHVDVTTPAKPVNTAKHSAPKRTIKAARTPVRRSA